MKIYTKTGDKGKTSLFGGSQVNKGDLRIEAYGNVDELNSQIGLIIAFELPSEVIKKLMRVQTELLVLGSDLATPMDIQSKNPRINQSFISRLEKEIDTWDKGLPRLTKFILPGGSRPAALLHLARSISRRAERSIVRLAHVDKINQKDIMYVNRLSDWLFTLARFVNKLTKVNETEWEGRG